MAFSKSLPVITVTIATYDSGRTIEKCLQSIKKQTYPNIDIVVVDSLYYDEKKQRECRRVIKKYARYFQDGPERSIQRNRGIKEARGEYILIIDQDMYLTPKIVQECYKLFLNKKYSALTIPEISIGEGFWTECVTLERYVTTYLEKGMNECCRFFRKSDALKIGGYDPEIVGVEDSDFHYRMLKMGKIGKIKNHIYHDEGRTEFWKRVRKKYYYSRAFREYLRRYPKTAVGQFSPFKVSYLKHWKLFIKKPFVSIGIVCLRSAEVCAGALGLIMKS